MRENNKALTPFGKLVAKALIDRNMTRAELAAIVGTSPQNLSRILNGTRPGNAYVPRIVASLSIDPRKAERAIAA